MDKEKKNKTGIIEGAIASFRSEAERRKDEKSALTVDVAVFLCAFIFARRHLILGAYPLASALVAVLPCRVWICAIGAVAGSLSLGRSGIIHAIISLIILFLRIIISAGKMNRENESLFSEPLISRLSSATIGAFVGSGYEMLVMGFSFSSVLFSVASVLSTPLFALLYSGLFLADISASEILLTDKTLLRKKHEKDDYGILFFQVSAGIIIFLLSLSLKEYDYFGVSLAYVYSVALTLYVSKRFGGYRGMAAGFISSVAISPLYAPASALLGIVAALLYPFSVGYAIIGAGAVFCLWGAYVGGVGGLLSVLSEYMIGALLISSVLKRAPTEKEEEVRKSLVSTAEEMVGASRLSDKAKMNSMAALEESLSLLSVRIKELSREEALCDLEEYRSICFKILSEENLPKNREIITVIATKLYKKQRFSEKEQQELEEHGVPKSALKKIFADSIEYEKRIYARKKNQLAGEQYTILSRMINEARRREEREYLLNEELTERAREVFTRHGFPEGCITVLGDEKIRVIGAGLDKDGTLITSPELKALLEEAIGVKLGAYEYFRREDMALFKARSVARCAVKHASVGKCGRPGEISGDSAKFCYSDTEFFSIISDGMGSGREARELSDFATAYLSDILPCPVSPSSAIAALNGLIRAKGTECTASVDLFSLDLVRGDGTFIKCGAVPSFIKRGRSIFRMRSESAPIGLLPTVDAEKIRVEVKCGDVIVMLSDGVASSVEDSAWLLSFLGENDPTDCESYANEILKRAAANSPHSDDMTVCVLSIEPI